jgi:uncharacterized membrane protein YdbT with pleckstrin-like domain
MSESTDGPSWVTLTEGEQIMWNGHPSVWSISRWLVVGIILLGLGIAGFVRFTDLLQLLSLVPIVIGLLLIVVQTIRERQQTRYVITSEEVYKKTGLLSRDVTNFRIDRIQNTSYTQSFLERLLTYGTIRIEMAGTGESDLVLHDIPDPKYVIGIITERLDKASSQPQDQSV